MPNARQTKEDVEVSPFDTDFSGFIFKIQANMDPKHRDRIAFMRVVSGAFERGMDVTLQRTSKNKRLHDQHHLWRMIKKPLIMQSQEIL